MNKPDQNIDTVPLIIFASDRSVSAVGLINEKAYKKSIEQSQLWKVDESTSRVLPADSGPLVSLRSFDGWVEAICGETPDSDHSPSPNVEDSEPTGGADESALANDSVLQGLFELIRRRREERPQGSYTTYLFGEGSEKIRKKTGEEAIELILEKDRGRIISEAADLVYHLLVLLEVEGIELQELLSLLSERRSE